jgi:hypothetical protein
MQWGPTGQPIYPSQNQPQAPYTGHAGQGWPPPPPQGWNHACPRCGGTSITRPGFTWWGGLVGPKLLDHRVCSRCHFGFNGRTGYSSVPGIVIYFLSILAVFLLVSVWVIGPRSLIADVLDFPFYVLTGVVLACAALAAKAARPDAWGPLLAAGLIKVVDGLLHWVVSIAFTLTNGSRDHSVVVDISDVVSKLTGLVDILATVLLAVALLRLARPPVAEGARPEGSGAR